MLSSAPLDSPSTLLPRIERDAEVQDGQTRMVVRGAWTASGLGTAGVWTGLTAQMQSNPVDAVWDLLRIDDLDHVGAQALWDFWGQALPPTLQANARERRLLDTVAQFTTPPPKAASRGWSSLLLIPGGWLLAGMSHGRGVIRLVGQLLLDVLQLLRRPDRAPWRDMSSHLYRVGATALPITALVGFLIGVVLAYLLSQQLRQFGAEAFIVDLLGVTLIRELGPMLAAILIAGRSGSAITAQIGVMRVTEELDAMRVMGIARGFRLVMPRALALAIAMPLVSAWTTLVALLGGMLAADVAMDVSPSFFIQALPAAVQGSNLLLATAKSMVFGVLIALIACHYGLRVKPNTQSLGEGTTASVVTSITAVILVDAVFAVVFRDVGI
jgi:phospholipid/cholesterol/gamma-HCH transport system permease protein